MIFDLVTKWVFKRLVEQAYGNAVSKGFHDKARDDTEERRRTAALMDEVDLVSARAEAIRSGGEPPPLAIRIVGDNPVRDAVDDSLLMLMVTEITEARSARHEYGRSIYYRADGKPEGEVAELADVVIRIFDYSGKHGLDLGSAILQKMAFNAGRAAMHGGKKL